MIGYVDAVADIKGAIWAGNSVAEVRSKKSFEELDTRDLNDVYSDRWNFDDLTVNHYPVKARIVSYEHEAPDMAINLDIEEW